MGLGPFDVHDARAWVFPFKNTYANRTAYNLNDLRLSTRFLYDQRPNAGEAYVRRWFWATALLVFGSVAPVAAQQVLPPLLASIAGKDCGGRVMRVGPVVSGAIVWIRLSNEAEGPVAHLYFLGFGNAFAGGFGPGAATADFPPHPPASITATHYPATLQPTGFTFTTHHKAVYTLTVKGQSLVGTYKESNGTMSNANLSCVLP
jgi:hypothetical protein